MGYTVNIDFAPGRPDLRPPARSQAEIRAEAEAQRRRRRLQAARGMRTRDLMRAPGSSKGE
jgi:hypothetical protein